MHAVQSEQTGTFENHGHEYERLNYKSTVGLHVLPLVLPLFQVGLSRAHCPTQHARTAVL
jgi:hypothetical protein